VSIVNYRPYPLSIAALVAHELAHTMSVVHPWELSQICSIFPTIRFCTKSILPSECLCDTDSYPPEQCLMTFYFGRAVIDPPMYTPCDIELMNYFSSNSACIMGKVSKRQMIDYDKT
ncbi:unnamed protein product, partial [Didymodactylos carnosus]